MEVHRYPRKTLFHGELSHSQMLALAIFIHPKQFGAFPRSLVLPYSYEEILSGYEEDVSSIRDGFTAWVKADPETILRRHIVDLTRA